MEALVLNKSIVILGDLNCDGLKNNCVEYKTMDRFLNEMNLTQLIKSPTTITDSTQSLLDVILVSSKSIVYRIGVLLTSISDHLLVYAELKIKSPIGNLCNTLQHVALKMMYRIILQLILRTNQIVSYLFLTAMM